MDLVVLNTATSTVDVIENDTVVTLNNGTSTVLEVSTAPPGVGMPRGGTTGQYLIKASNADFDFAYATVVGGGGSGGAALSGLTDVLIGTPASPQVLKYNGTKWANVALVSTDISNFTSAVQTIVNTQLDIAGAPATLDTLNELAAALNDDANFASTVTTSLATKATDTAVVHLAGAETISGAKTFSASPIVSGLQVTDATNLVLGTTTGTKIGTATTQKIGFFNATPVVQQSATADLGTALSNLGLRAAGTAYTITTTGAVSTGALSVTALRLGTATTAGFVLTADASGNATWQQSTGTGNATVVDATSTTKGIIQLTGDLGGTAASPTVPGLANKAALVHTHSGADITTGTLAIAVIPTGTTASTVALGNHTHTGVYEPAFTTLTGKTISGATNTLSNIPESAVTNLTTDLTARALDSAVVHLTGAETIAGVKTFTSNLIVPAGTFSVAATGGLQDLLDAKMNIGIAGLPSGSVVFVNKSGTTWPARPTARTDIKVIWQGADPPPAIVQSGTGGMLDGQDVNWVIT